MALVFDTNNITVTGSQSMYNFKALLAGAGSDVSQGTPGGAGWTVVASSDGTTFNTSGSGIDYWQSGSAVAKGCANTNAWIVLQMPLVGGVNRQILIQRNVSNLDWRVGYSYSAGFVGTANGAISATVAPTATDGQSIINNSAIPAQGFQGGGATYISSFFTTDNTYVFSCCAQDAAPYGTWMTAITAPYDSTVLLIDPLAAGSYTSADVDPYVFYGASSNTTTLYSGNTTSNGFYHAWLKKGLPGEGWVSVYDCTPTIGFSSIAVNPALATTYLGNNNADETDIILPLYYGRNFNKTAPTGGKGISTLTSYSVSGRAVKDTISVASAGAKDYIVVGTCALNWDGSVPV